MNTAPGASCSARLRRRRLLSCAALCVFVGLIALWLAAAHDIAYQSTHPARRKLLHTPAEFGLSYENVVFPSTGGLKLHGWFLPVAGNRPLIVLCHGYPANRGDIVDIIAFLHRAHFNVFTFDFRGLGESDGQICTLGYREVDDALSAVQYLHHRPDTRPLPLGFMGYSMGGAVAIMAANRQKSIRAVVADSPYASLDHAVMQHFRSKGSLAVILGWPARWFGEQMTGTRSALVSPLREVVGISPRPLLLISGSADTTVQPGDDHLLFAAARQPKQLWIVPGAPHCGGWVVARQEYEARVTNFFDKALVTKP